MVVTLAAIGEVRRHITETGKRHAIPGTILTIAADPVREVDHHVRVNEHVRPRHLAQTRVKIVEPAALQLSADSDNRMQPFGYRQVAFESETLAASTQVSTVRESRTGTQTGRYLPIIPETVRDESCKTRLLGGSFSPSRNREYRDCESQENLFHIKYVLLHILLTSHTCRKSTHFFIKNDSSPAKKAQKSRFFRKKRSETAFPNLLCLI